MNTSIPSHSNNITSRPSLWGQNQTRVLNCSQSTIEEITQANAGIIATNCFIIIAGLKEVFMPTRGTILSHLIRLCDVDSTTAKYNKSL